MVHLQRSDSSCRCWISGKPSAERQAAALDMGQLLVGLLSRLAPAVKGPARCGWPCTRLQAVQPRLQRHARTPSAVVQVDADVSFSSKLKRTELQLDSKTVSIETLLERPMELPAVDDRRIGRKHDHVFGYTADFDAPGIGICKAGPRHMLFTRTLY